MNTSTYYNDNLKILHYNINESIDLQHGHKFGGRNKNNNKVNDKY